MTKRDTILIVDDCEDLTFLMAQFFERSGFRSDTSRTAQDGKEKAIANWDRLCAVTVDLVLDGAGSGLLLVEYLMRKKIPCPVIVVTGMRDDYLELRALEVPVLRKPVSGRHLIAEIMARQGGNF